LKKRYQSRRAPIQPIVRGNKRVNWLIPWIRDCASFGWHWIEITGNHNAIACDTE
jgi:hypothetical protein